MINYFYEINKSKFYWIVDIYANSDLLRSYSYATKQEVEGAAQAFIDGVKFARGEKK